MAQTTYLARKDEDVDFAALTCDSLVVNDTTIDAGAITMADDELLTIGTGSDVTIEWDSTNLIVAAAADDTLIEIGDSAETQLSFDVKIYGNAASGADYIMWDASESRLKFEGAMVGANTPGETTLDFANWIPIEIDIDGTAHYIVAAQTVSATA
jgi:hypothetical protein